jgi:Uma2 family endonuclease
MVTSYTPIGVPPLENGDHLSRTEFERIWDLHPEIKKAELIDGMVFCDMTVSRRHSKHHSRLNTWLGVFEAHAENVEVLDNATVRLGDDDVQPDALVRIVAGGASEVSDDDCVIGPPELVAEVAASSSAYDMNLKKALYRSHGVQEYLVWQVFENRIDWWQLVNGEYIAFQPDQDGIISSRVFSDLRLDVAALLAGDMAAVLAALS